MTAIVVGTDGSEGGMAAVVRAGRLAAATGGRVVVVSAYGAAPATASMAPEAAMAMTHGQDRATAALKRAAEQLEADGIEHDTRAVCGGPVDALCEVAAIEKAQTIVVGSRGMRGAGRLLGSVPNAVTHRSPCDVLVVRTD